MVSKSRGRGEITELTHVAPIKQGLVPEISQRITYADRLRTVLEAFHTREDQGFPGVTRLFRGIHTSQWAMLDGDTRLMLNVIFDGGLHGYLRALAYTVPHSLALVWSNCEGWADVANDPQALIEFIERFQVRNNFFFAQNPQLTVPDIEALLRLREVHAPGASAQDMSGALYEASHPRPLAERTEEAMCQYERAQLAELGQPNPTPALLQAARAKSRAIFHELLDPLYSRELVAAAMSETFRDAKAPASAAAPDTERAQQIQGNVLTHYENTQAARMYFFSFESPEEAREWLQLRRRSVTFFQDQRAAPYINIGFTYAGLEALSVDRAVLKQFPAAFEQGMDQRAKVLGDQALVPASWTKTFEPNRPVHAVLIVYADTRGAADVYDQLIQAGSTAQAAAEATGTAATGAAGTTADHYGMADALSGALAGFLDEVAARLKLPTESSAADESTPCIGYQDLHLPLVPIGDDKANAYPVEYFGFRDGISQPRMPLGQASYGPNDELPSFDSVLVSGGRGLLKNATFMVARQLRQDTAAFWEAMEENAQALRTTRRELAEQIVGRRMDGRRLDSSWDAFDPQRDQHAFDVTPAQHDAVEHTSPACPFHSHARRMNPRTEADPKLNPRLMRRSIAYVNKRNSDYVRGLMFIAFNADIERQFELMQRNWVHAGNQAGLSSSDRDVLSGVADKKSAATRFYAELPNRDGEPSPNARELRFQKSFVELEWGIYLYIPAREALNKL